MGATELGSAGHFQTGHARVAALFGDDSDSQPLWFKKEAFSEPNFVSEVYIADLRRFVPFETLRAELKNHLAALKNELVELINRDYTDFVNLSTKLVDVDGAVLRMRLPLNELLGKLQGVRQSVAVALQALHDGLQRRAHASRARLMLELLLDTSHVLSKVEKLLEELQRMPAGSLPTSSGTDTTEGAELEDARSRLLERIASEMNRLKFCVVRAQDLPFVLSMERRIAAADKLLADNLGKSLEWGLIQRDQRVIYNCLRAYAALDSPASAENLFRSAIVAPCFEGLLPVPAASAAGAVDTVQPAVTAAQLLVDSDCRFVLDLASAPNSGLHSFKFLSNSILREFHMALHRTRPGAFSPGRPTEFLANYKSCLTFLDFLEGYCPTQADVVAFRTSSSYSDFMKLWNLGAYFNLRFGEIASAVDQVLSVPTAVQVSVAERDSRAQQGNPPLALEASAALWNSLQRCWAPDVHVAALSDKFVRLTLQLLTRFTTWVSTGLANRRAAAGGAAAANTSPEWALTALPEDLILVRHDIETLVYHVSGNYTALVGERLGQAIPKQARTAAQQAVQSAAASLQELIPLVSEALTDSIADKCAEVLRQVKGITTTYRMTNKPLPTRHSLYVTSVLQPLKVFLDGDGASNLGSDKRDEIVNSVVIRVTARYFDMARDLVTTVRKTESSLKLMKARATRKGVSADSSASSVSDTDKITAQLFFDVQEYGRQLMKFGVDCKLLEAYQSLWTCVAPEGRQEIDI